MKVRGPCPSAGAAGCQVLSQDPLVRPRGLLRPLREPKPAAGALLCTGLAPISSILRCAALEDVLWTSGQESARKKQQREEVSGRHASVLHSRSKSRTDLSAVPPPWRYSVTTSAPPKLNRPADTSIQTLTSLTASSLLMTPLLTLNLWIWGSSDLLYRSSPPLPGWTGPSVDRFFLVCPRVFDWLPVWLLAAPLNLNTVVPQTLLGAPGCVEVQVLAPAEYHIISRTGSVCVCVLPSSVPHAPLTSLVVIDRL